MTGENVCVNFGVANAIGGVDVKFAGWDYSPMLPCVCSPFTCHIETIKRKLTHYRKHGTYSIYYLTSKRIGNHSTEQNGLEKLLKLHIAKRLTRVCPKKYGFFLFDCLSDKYTARTLSVYAERK